MWLFREGERLFSRSSNGALTTQVSEKLPWFDLAGGEVPRMRCVGSPASCAAVA